MGAMCTYLKNKLLDHAVGKTAYTMPTAYVALGLGTFDAAGAWTNEMTAGDATNGYSRQATTGTTWQAAASGATQNDTGQTVTFGPASGNWSGACTYMALADDGTRAAGNMLWFDDITSTQVNTGESLAFAAGTIDITLS